MLIVPKRKWLYPLAIEREYAKLLVAYVDKEIAIVESFLPEMADAVWRNGIHVDGIDDWLENIVDKIKKKIKSALSAVPVIGKIFKQVNQHVSREMVETSESLFGNRPRQLNNTRELEMTKTIWTSQNLTLIKSIDQQILDKIRFAMSQRIIRTADREQTLAALADDIQSIAGNARNRAVLIAVDQVGKLNSQLTQYRQMNMGVEEYIWNTMKDSRVRPEHRAREGRKFKWSEPPADGHPRWPIRCRCTALPVLDTDKVGLEPRRNTFTKVSEDGMIDSGAIYGALYPDSERAEEHAVRYYEAVRKRKGDAKRIANNTWVNGVSRFYPSYRMAESWRRLFEGKNIQPHDITMIKHEILERKYVLAGLSQEEAHKKTEAEHNYKKEADAYYAKNPGRKKNE